MTRSGDGARDRSGKGGGYQAVLIAASAGGLAAATEVLKSLPADFALPVVMVQHLHPDHRSKLAWLLDNATKLRVRVVEDGARLEAGTVLVAPPRHHVTLDPEGRIHLTETALVNYVRPSADVLFSSAAASGVTSIAVVLTGTGHDGSEGVRKIVEGGGAAIVQAEAEFPSMPEAALASLGGRAALLEGGQGGAERGRGGSVMLLPLSEIGPALVELASGLRISGEHTVATEESKSREPEAGTDKGGRPGAAKAGEPEGDAEAGAKEVATVVAKEGAGEGAGEGAQGEEGTEEEFRSLLEYLQRARGFDFSSYKTASLSRRMQRRMQLVGVTTYLDYIDYLEVHPDEFDLLFNTVLINVTSFFRDKGAWEHVRDEIIPRLIETKRVDEPIRIWSAGCASGQEAYTAAMLLAEALGIEHYKARAKIYATDIDEDALITARLATYDERALDGVPPELREKYFDRVRDQFVLIKGLRRQVIFGRHDLLQDAPISRIDFLICRNTLMYFNAEAQSHVMSRLWFALADHGYLFLGKAEMLLTRSGLFTPEHLQHRIFAKLPRAGSHERVNVLTGGGGLAWGVEGVEGGGRGRPA